MRIAPTWRSLRIAREASIKTALDIDYRPNLWGVAGHGEGDSRFVESERVTAKLQSSLHLFDLIVGTEEEFRQSAGMVAPASLYLAVVPPGSWSHGWRVPMSIDTAFAVALIAMLGARVPVSGQAFPVEAHFDAAKIAVFVAAVLSAVIGVTLLSIARRKPA